jgi:hypothetical protein
MNLRAGGSFEEVDRQAALTFAAAAAAGTCVGWCMPVIMFLPSIGSLREPSSSVGRPNIAGSGGAWPVISAVNGPRWLVTAMKCAIPAPQPLRW